MYYYFISKKINSDTYRPPGSPLHACGLAETAHTSYLTKYPAL